MPGPLSLAFDVSFEEAIAAARARGVVLPDEFYSDLQEGARTRGFTISTIESLETIQGVLDDLNESIAAGSTFAQWQEDIGGLLDALSPARQELVFRQAAQTAYGIGHTVRQRQYAGTRPFLMWDAINDSRTRASHAAMDGFIAHIGDPVWQHWHVPAGFNCRCARISLSEDQAVARGYPMPPPAASPDPGFDGPDPADAWDDVLDAALDQRTTLLPQPIKDAVERINGGK